MRAVGFIRARCARRGFTLLELLIVAVIVAVLAGLTLSGGNMMREKAREHSTSVRLQNILGALTQYSTEMGSPGVALQINLGLGGVPYFAPIASLNTYATKIGCAKPPGFVQWTWAPPISAPVWTRTAFDATNYSANPERITLWRRLTDEVFDAKPPTSPAWSTADYELAGKDGAWPTQWPETDWDAASPGDHPPILRFPWGKPGLRVNASICDASQSPGATTTILTERTTSAGAIKELPPQPVQNNWVTTGSAASGRIWKWTASSPTQTDAVTLTEAYRSDDLSTSVIGADPLINANAPLPFDEGWMSPLKTIPLLQAAGVLRGGDAGAEDYRTQRKPSQQWNDAWGRPLIVVYAMFQPERFVRDFDGENRRDLLLNGARKGYQYNRSFYFAAGAPGPTLATAPAPPATWSASADPTALRDYWKQVRDVAGAASFTEASFAAPPWKGIKIGKKGRLKSLLTMPIEMN